MKTLHVADISLHLSEIWQRYNLSANFLSGQMSSVLKLTTNGGSFLLHFVFAIASTMAFMIVKRKPIWYWYAKLQFSSIKSL